MNVFIIPSWYPSAHEPVTGVFFREQARIYANFFLEDNVGIGHWGPNDHRLLLEKKNVKNFVRQLLSKRKIQSERRSFSMNCHEYFTPAFTWTRKLLQGNVDGLVKASIKNLRWFEHECGKVDVIHAHVGYPAGQVAMRLSSELEVPYILTEHMVPFPFNSFLRKGKIRPCLGEPLQKANKVLAVSKYFQSQLAKNGIDSSVFYNFIDDDFFNIGTSVNKEFTFLNVARLEDQKNQGLILRSAARIPMEFNINIAGEGSLDKKLRALCNELGLENKVRFLGPLDRIGVKKEMQNADAFLLSSRYESFGVSVLEALFSGLPVISTKCGGPEEMITGNNGFLVGQDDEKGFSSRMLQLASGEVSFDKREIRKGAIEKFGSGCAAKQLRKHYMEVIKASS